MQTVEFEYILDQIFHPTVREFTRKCLEDANSELEIIPASTSGRYHPRECNVEGGLIVHIQRACFFGNVLLKSHKLDESLKGDILISAILLHDIGKKAKYEDYQRDYVNHPLVAAREIAKHKDILPEKVFNIISSCVIHHMGPWTPKSHKKPMEKYTQLELFTYLADFLATQKIKVDPDI